MERSFWAYVKHNLSDLIESNVEKYARKYIQSRKWGKWRANIDDIELWDTEIKSVRVENDEGWKIQFDIIVEATFIVHDPHNDGEDEDFSEWFLLCCGGNLAEGLQDAHVISIEAYNAKRAFQSPMTDKLIPFIKNEEYDDTAEEMLHANLCCEKAWA